MNKHKIMIVEDETIIAMDMRYMLEENEFDVIAVVDNAESAIDIFLEKKPDLILLDVLLKGEKTGIDLYFELKERSENFRAIFLTGNAYLLKEHFGKKLNDIVALSKPIDDHEFVPIVKNVLQQ